jgi:glucose-6-phosphate isomerase
MSAVTDPWETLARTAASDPPLRRLFEAEPDRVHRLTFEACGLALDLSKQPWSAESFTRAVDLARACGLEAAREALFAGEAVNASEGRAVLHMALRDPGARDWRAGDQAVAGSVRSELDRMLHFAWAVRNEGVIRAVVHIGIGGSDLGPRLVWEALAPAVPGIELRFAANVDPSEITAALAGLDPARTLVIVVSKTFTTQETLFNARAARAWLATAPGAETRLAAVTAAPGAAADFGVAADRIFPFADWVGGRFSLWSAVGLSCAIGLGPETFAGLLAGAATMDSHFLSAPPEESLPVVLALAHVLNRDILGRPARAVVPYARRLRLLPAFLQQLEMESNGKRVGRDGQPVDRPTAGVVFGEPGTNGQHAFFQALHQGTDVIPLDILAVRKPVEGDPAAHLALLANAIAQAEALMAGRTEAEALAAAGGDPVLAAQKAFPGDRPSGFLLMERLDAPALGALLALFEHKVFVEGVLWGLNSFDQWGVELGKVLAARILPELEGGALAPHDASTAALIARLRGE